MQKTYGAIVIGTGMSGGWAMKELTEKGLKVIALERARNIKYVNEYDSATLNRWDVPHRGNLICAFVENNLILVLGGVVDKITTKM